MNEIERLKAYAKRLEEIIDAATMEAHVRMVVNSLVGEAKEKYNMYNL